MIHCASNVVNRYLESWLSIISDEFDRFLKIRCIDIEDCCDALVVIDRSIFWVMLIVYWKDLPIMIESPCLMLAPLNMSMPFDSSSM